MGVNYSIVGGWGIVLDEEAISIKASAIANVLGPEWTEELVIEDRWETIEALADKYNLSTVVAGNFMSGESMAWLIGANTYDRDLYEIEFGFFGTSPDSKPLPSADEQHRVYTLIGDLHLIQTPQHWTGASVG